MAPAIPSAAKALVLPEYNLDHVAAVRSLRVEERAVPSPGPGQVLVRVEAAACNPSDIIFDPIVLIIGNMPRDIVT